MKKILYILFASLIVLTGCNKKEQTENGYNEKKLKDILIKYAKSVYESDSFPNKEPSKNVYILELKVIKSIGKDTSMFVGKDGKACNENKTYATFKILDAGKYEYDAILDCG
jgi:hypothetical protein